MDEGEDEERNEGEKIEAGNDGAKSATVAFPEQVMAFKTRGELGQYASRLQLARAPLAELKPQPSLSDAYAGGEVVGIFSGELTQGSVVLLLQDEPRSNKYVQCVISGDVTRLLPTSAQLGVSEVYLHRVRVVQTTAECSQEMELEIRVEGEEEKVWIVNREAGSGSFLPTRQPSEFQGRGGNVRKARRQRHMKAGLERERMANVAPSPVAVSTSPSESVPTTSTAPHTSSAPDKHSDSRALESAGPSSTASHYATGPDPPPSTDPPSASPDQRETSDSVLGAHSIRVSTHEDELGEEEGGIEDNKNIESSSDDLSSSEGSVNGGEDGSGGGQDRRLFPYRSSTRERQAYTYKKVAELEAGMQKVNVFGVVTDFQPPFQTKGRDICSIVNILDESVHGSEPFKCTFFHSNQEKLPKVDKVGDIVCFHRINIKMFPSGVQGIGQSFSSSLAFTGRLGAKVKPVTGSVSYTFAAQDKKRVKELRLWSARQHKTNNPFARALKDVAVDATSTSLVCQVLSISVRAASEVEEGGAAVLCVWDGTRFPQRGLELNLSAFNTTAMDSELMRLAEPFSERVVVYGRELVGKVATLTPGQFVCLQNMQIKMHTRHNSFTDVFDAVELRLLSSHNSSRESSIKVLTSSDIEVYELKRSLKKCRHQVTQFRPLPPDIVPSGITETLHRQQPPVPLSAITKTEAPAKFRCIVKVLGIKPQSVEEMVQLRCDTCKHKMAVTKSTKSDAVCPKCMPNQRRRKNKTRVLKPAYFFRLTLADETGHVEVYVSGQQAAQFLTGFPPANFFQQPQQRISLLESLYCLTGGNDPFDGDAVECRRPWVDVCIVSMKDSGSVGGGNVTYHLFDTVLQSIAV